MQYIVSGDLHGSGRIIEKLCNCRGVILGHALELTCRGSSSNIKTRSIVTIGNPQRVLQNFY